MVFGLKENVFDLHNANRSYKGTITAKLSKNIILERNTVVLTMQNIKMDGEQGTIKSKYTMILITR